MVDSLFRCFFVCFFSHRKSFAFVLLTSLVLVNFYFFPVFPVLSVSSNANNLVPAGTYQPSFSSIPFSKGQSISNNTLYSAFNFLFTSAGYSISGISVDSSYNIYLTGSTGNNLVTKNAFNSTFGGYGDVFIAEISSNGSLVYSSYLGGNNSDFATAIALDSSGNAYVTGYTYSANFPTKNAYNGTYGGSEDAFLAKFTSSGSLAFSTFLGGNDTDIGSAIALDSSGNAYVTGSTYSANFPTKDAYNSTYGGLGDGFVAEFTPDGSLIFSTFLGGSSFDSASAIAVDTSGNSYITGTTSSVNFPTKNAYNSTYGGSVDSFLTKFDSSGLLVFSTYFGGNNSDIASGIAVDSSGNAYVTGFTLSDDFPTKQAYYPTHFGYYQQFLSKFSSTGKLIFSTFVSGSISLIIDFSAITLDSNGNFYIISSLSTYYSYGSYFLSPFSSYFFVYKFNSNGLPISALYLSGWISSGQTDIVLDSIGNCYITGMVIFSSIKDLKIPNFTDDTYNTSYGGINDVFIIKLDPNGKLIFKKFLGVNFGDTSSSIAVDKNGNVYIAGTTSSAKFPTKDAYNNTFGGEKDVFIAKFNSAGSLIFSTFLGGSGFDSASAIADDTSGNSYLTGTTSSINFPTKNPINDSITGFISDFISKFTPSGYLLFSTYFGGNNFNIANSIAVGLTGNIYISGSTSSFNFPTKNKFNYNFTGGTNAYLTIFNSSFAILFSASLSNILSPLTSTLSKRELFFSLFNLQTITWILISCVLILIALIGFFIAIKYIEYNCSKKRNNNTTEHSFKAFFNDKFFKKDKNRTSKNLLSEKTFEILEEIEKENSLDQ